MRRRTLILLCLLGILSAGPASAHQPYAAYGAELVDVADPEISKAYYGALRGTPVTYRIVSDMPFDLYVNVLVPASVTARTDIAVTFRTGGRDVSSMGGPDAVWVPWHEEFAGDDYLRGPEFRREDMPPGIYEVVVSSPYNAGPYVLAVGELESFTPKETVRTLLTLPFIKVHTFGKSPFAVYEGVVGTYLGYATAAVILIVVLMAAAAVRRFRAK